MSKSLAIINGDLQVGSGRAFALVSGKRKLMQDLRLWVLERIGIDPLLPSFGNALDGGSINGETYESMIGNVLTQELLNEIRIEILDLVSRYQSMQFNKMQDEALLFNGNNTLDADEVIDEILDVKVVAVGTTILVQVVIQTLGGSTLKLTVPVEGEPA
jgi:hypothetical protein